MSPDLETDFYEMLMQAPAAIAIVRGKSLEYQFANPEYQRIFGRNADKIVGKTISEIWPEIEGQGIVELFLDIFSTGNPFISSDYPATFYDAGKLTTRYFDFIAKPIRTAGEVSHIMIHAVDVTNRVASHELEHRSTRRFEAAVKAVEGVVWTNSPDGKMVGEQPGWSDLTGQTFDEYQGFGWASVVHPDDAQPTIDAWTHAVERKIPFVFKHRLKVRDGRWRIFSIKAIPIIENESIREWVGVHTDITDIQRAGEKIRQGEKRYKALLEKDRSVIWTTNEKGEFCERQASWENYTGQSFEEYRGTGWLNMIHPDDRRQISDVWFDAVRGGHEFVCPGRLWNREYNGYRSFIGKASPVTDDNGRIVEWVGINTDIHDEVEAHQQLESAFKQLPAAIYLYDANGKVTYANDLAAQLSGYASAGELTRLEHFRDFRNQVEPRFHIVDESGRKLEPSDYTVAIAIRTKATSEKVLHFTNRQTGESTWHLSRSSPMFNSQGELNMILTTVTDITLQKKSELAIRESEARFRMLIEAFPHMAWMADSNGVGIYYNKRYHEYTGLTEEDARDNKAYKVIHPEDWNNTMAEWNKHISEGLPLELELRYWHAAAQEYVWFLVRAVPIEDAEGRVTTWVGTSTQIQHLKNLSELLEQQVQQRTKELNDANEQLAQQALELQQSNDELQQFAHVASHDLKEPVRKIRLYSDRIMRDHQQTLPQQVLTLVNKIENSSRRLADMIDGILAYSSFEGTSEDFGDVDLERIVQEIAVDLEVKFAEKNAVLTVAALHHVHGSSILMSQLFYNLINNALKFSRPGVPPVIAISSRILTDNPDATGRNRVEVTVSDNGIGFDSESAEQIFRKFVRLNPKDHYEGTGLGLALCKKIVERHGGTITASSVLNEGSEFKVVMECGRSGT